MKTILLLILLLCSRYLYAQDDLPLIRLPQHGTVHVISPEPIRYVDIADRNIAGDLPLANVLRLKLRDSVTCFTGTVLTVVGEKFYAQYRLLPGGADAPGAVEIVPADIKPLDLAGIGLSQSQLRQLALNLLARKPGKHAEKIKAFGIAGSLNHVYAVDDYVFLDVSYLNKTNISYDIDDIRFSVDDKKVTRAANSQSVEISPVLALSGVTFFKKYYRNIFVFKKMSFPGNKVLRIALSEKQLSGRMINLTISYRDILQADALPAGQ